MAKTILVNKENLIKDNYLNRVNLIETLDVDNEKVLVEEETYKNYLDLKKYLEENNIEIGISSAYRSIKDQEDVMNDFIERYGTNYASKVVAPIRASEHHTGLAIDINIKLNDKYPSNNQEIEDNVSYYEDIHKYLKDFGFILRYPKGKEDITGYPYEPWHIRYVGKIPATIIYNNNWTLEEYLKDFNGLIAINKEKDVTSFDVVNDISHIFGIKRVGHTGTLDPLAEGVLIVAIGKATKVVELVTSSYKTYIAGVKLGIETDSLDITGTITKESKIPENINIEEVLKSYEKTYMQEVPKYSAVKVNGKKLYEYARNNKEVELPKKEVTIKNIKLLENNNDTFKFISTVSKGTYIRSLIRDIGNSLGTNATMTSLIRTNQAKIDIKDTYKIEDIKNNNYKLYTIDEILDIPTIEVNEDIEYLIKNGRRLDNTYNIEDKVIFKNKKNKILGIYIKDEENLKVWKNFE